MAKQKTLRISEQSDYSGIQITFRASEDVVRISAWYDNSYGIEGGSFSLRELFDKLGITDAHCKKAFSTTTECEK